MQKWKNANGFKFEGGPVNFDDVEVEGINTAGGINHVSNPDAERNTDGWDTYDDGTSSTPVDGKGKPAGTVAVENTSQNGFAIVTTETHAGNTFTLSSTTDIHSLAMGMSKGAGATGSIKYELWNTSAGLPTGSPLAETETIDVSSLPTDSPTNIATALLTTELELEAGVYAVTFTEVVAVTGGNLNFAQDTGNPYAGGQQVFSTDSASSWNANATQDSVFQVFPVGSTDVTLIRSTNVNDVLRGDASFKFSKDAADRQGQGVSLLTLDIDPQDQGKELDISFDYKSSANYLSDDMTVHIYDITNDELIYINEPEIASTGSTRQTFQGRFTSASDSTNYRLILHIATTNATAYDIAFDNIRVGPKEFINVPIITEWVDYTPTITGFGTVIGVDFQSRRVGDTLEVTGAFGTGTPVGSTATVSFGFNGVDGNVVRDSDKMVSNTVCGYYGVGVAAKINALMLTTNDTSVTFGANDQSGNPVASQTGTQVTSSSSISIQVSFRVAIVGWNSGSLISTTQANNENVIAAYRTDAGQAIGTGYTVVDFEDIVIDTHNAVSTGAGWKFTVPSTGKYLVSSGLHPASNDSWNFHIFLNGVINCRLGQDPSVANYEGSSAIIDVLAGDEIDIRCISGSANTLVADADVNHISINKLPDVTNFGVYGISEHVEAKDPSSVAWPITAAQFGDLDSITLPPGEWDITAQWECLATGAPGSIIQSQIGISTTSGNSTTGLSVGDNRLRDQVPNVSGQCTSIVLANYRVNILNSTTYYLKAYLGVTTNMNLSGYRISARRIS